MVVFNMYSFGLSVILLAALISTGNGQYVSEEQYFDVMDRSGRHKWLPLIQSLLQEYSQYAGLTNKLSSLTCPLIVHKNSNTTIEVESWCFDLDGYVNKDVDTAMTYVNYWIDKRNKLTDIALYCGSDVTDGPPSRNLTKTVALPTGMFKDVQVPSFQCYCQNYNFTLKDGLETNSTQPVRKVDTYRHGPCLYESNVPSSIGFLPNLQRLTIYHTFIYGLKRADLVHFPNLLVLRIIETPLVNELLEDGLLCSVPNLLVLHVDNSYGNLQTFPSQIFNCSKPINLRYAFISSHNFNELPDNAFGQAVANIQYISLHENGLKVLSSKAFMGMKNLKYISLIRNSLDVITGDFDLLPSLSFFQYTDLQSHQSINLTSLNIARQSNIRFFSWGLTEASSISGRFCKKELTQLTKIQVTWNQLSLLPDDLFADCVSLMYLNLNNNELEKLEGSVFSTELPKLDYFSAANNNLKESSGWMKVLQKMPNVTYFNVSGNHICEWKTGLSLMPALEQVDLSHNCLQHIARDIFKGLTKLQFLRLDGNMLEHIPAGLLHGLHSLSGVILSDNGLTEVYPQSLAGLEQLMILDISGNNFREGISLEIHSQLIGLDLSNSSLRTCPTLHSSSTAQKILHIDLSYNTITSIFKNCTENVTYVNLDVEGNALRYIDPPICYQRPCDAISLHLINNQLKQIHLNCSLQVTYNTVNLTNNNISSIHETLGSPAIGACAISDLDLSRNELGPFLHPNEEFLKSVYDYFNHHGKFTHHFISQINLQFCHIKAVAKNTFAYIDFDKLDLSNNEIYIIDELALPQNRPRMTVNLQQNSLECNCQMLWMKYQHGKSTHVQYIAEACKNVLFGKIQKIQEIPDKDFMCVRQCHTDIMDQCASAYCYSRNDVLVDTDVIVCKGDHKGTILPTSVAIVKDRLKLFYFNITTLKLPFHEVSTISELYISDNQIVQVPVNSFEKVPNLIELYMHNNYIAVLQDGIFKGMRKLEVVVFTNNAIHKMGDLVFQPLYSLEFLLLDGNELSHLSEPLLQSIPQRPLQGISLYNNPWQCVCNDTFQYWILDHEDIVQLVLNITCHDTLEPVIKANLSCPSETVIRLIGHQRIAVVLPSVLAIIATIVLVVSVLIYRYHTFIAVIINTNCPVLLTPFKHNDQYGDVVTKDAFVIYDDQERDTRLWVKDVLIPELEPPYELICYDRDFLAGVDMAENIESAVESTSCAIVLITEGLMHNPWALTMLQACYNFMMEHQYKIILIFMEGTKPKDILSHEESSVELLSMIKAKMYLKVHQKMFWETLKYKMPQARVESIAEGHKPEDRIFQKGMGMSEIL